MSQTGSSYGTTSTNSTNSTSSTSSTADTAKNQASDVAQSAGDSAKQVAGTAQEQVRDVASEAKSQARNVGREFQTQVNEQAGQQRDRLVGTLRSLGDDLEQMADKGGQSGLATDLAHQVADRSRRAAGFLDGKEPGDLLQEATQFARRRSGAFLACAALAGVVAGRLTRGVKSNSSGPDTTYQSGPDTDGISAAGGYAAPPPEASSVLQQPHPVVPGPTHEPMDEARDGGLPRTGYQQ